MIDRTQRAIIRAKKNRMGKTFLRFAARTPSTLYKFWLAEPRRKSISATVPAETVWMTTNVDHNSVFAAKVGGETYYIKIEHPGLLTAPKTSTSHRSSSLKKRATRNLSLPT